MNNLEFKQLIELLNLGFLKYLLLSYRKDQHYSIVTGKMKMFCVGAFQYNNHQLHMAIVLNTWIVTSDTEELYF